MRLLRLLPERWQRFLNEAAKFGIVGGINTVINYAVFNALALTIFRDGQLKAAVVATLVATLTSYLMNRHWTYRDRPKSALRREYALFFLFNATGLLIELGVLALAKYGLGYTGLLALNVAKTAGVGLATIFRFWSYRTFVFRRDPAPASQAAADTTTATTTIATTTTGVGVSVGDQTRVGHTGHELLVELDPVAELAEVITESEPKAAKAEAPKAKAAKAEAARTTSAKAESAEAGAATAQRDAERGTPAKALEVQFAETIDGELAAELDAELKAASQRPASR